MAQSEIHIRGPYKEYRGHSIRYRVIVQEGDRVKRKRFSTEGAARRFIEGIKVLSTGEISIACAIDLFRRWKKQNVRPVTLRNVDHVHKFLAKHLDRPISAFTGRDAQRCYTDIVDAGCSVATHRQILKMTRSFFRWAIKQKWIKDNPCAEVEGVGRINRGKEQLRIDEARVWLQKALELANAGDQGAIAASLTLLRGLRASEVINRTVRDMDLDGRLLWIERGKTSSSNRTVEIPSVIRTPLLELAKGKAPDERLWPHKASWPNHQVRRICRLAGVREVCAHSMRGAYSSLSLMAGRGVEEIASSMGHTSPQITRQHYFGVGVEAQRNGRCVENILNIPIAPECAIDNPPQPYVN